MKYEILSNHTGSSKIKCFAKIIIKVIEIGDYTIITSDDLEGVVKIYKDYENSPIKVNITPSPEGSILIFENKDFLNYFWRYPGNYIEMLVGFNKRLKDESRKTFHL